jgi:carboxylesterase type B
MQYGYGDWVPSQSYYAFAYHAGCFDATAYGFQTKDTTIFNCLISKPTHTLQNASFYVSASSNYGIWGFLPVTDGVFIQNLPSKQLTEQRVNGQRLLIGNNADEGAYVFQ